jgi:DNA polymerase I-like protein with 3'-5' exonuclease and polymerase domains
MTTRLAEPLLYLAAQGLPVNQDNLVEAKRRVAADLEAKQEKLKQVAEWPFNPFSPKDCQKYFYKTKRIEPYTGQRGRPTTDDKALARIYRRYNLPEAKLVQEIRALHKLKATYIEVMLDPDGRLRCSWNSRGTWTGRLSSSQTIFGTGLNLQNLHPAFKSFIVAETCSHE